MFRFTLIFFFLLSVISYSQNNTQAFSSNLPIVIINTNGQSIIDNSKIIADMGIIYNGEGQMNQTSDPFNNYNGKIGIELRGSSSMGFPKKQYGVETRDSVGENLNVSLMGFPEENDWILNGPFSDKTLLRNVLVYNLAAQTRHYASRTKFCEVFINDDYKGVYVLLEKIKRDKNRVDIPELNPEDTTGNDVTGGYIIKVDKTDGENVGGWYSNYSPYPGAWQKTYYQYHEPKPDEIVPAQKEYIINYIQKFEAVMYSTNYNDPVLGYSNYIDVNSFVDLVILNELSKNVDGYRLSTFMYKNRENKDNKLYMGPVWDFNIALGNADYYSGQDTYGWMIEYLTSDSDFRSRDGFVPPFWWRKLWNDASFKNKVKERWVELRHSVLKLEKIFGFIDSITTNFKDARIRNFNRWQILSSYVWPNPYIGGTYENEITHLKSWIKARFLWIDNALTGAPVDVFEEPGVLNFVLHQNYPNPFNSVTTISYSIQESSTVRLDVFDILGNHVVSLVNGFQEPGNHSAKFDASALAGGVYIFRLNAGYYKSAKKGIYLK